MANDQQNYEVEACIVRPGRSEVSAKRSTIAFDSSPAMGGELPGPAELLCSAFAACLLKNVERFSKMLPFRQHGASVHVRTERQQKPPICIRIGYELRVVTDEPPEARRASAAKPRRVRNRLQHARRGMEISGEVVAVPTFLEGPGKPDE